MKKNYLLLSVVCLFTARNVDLFCSPQFQDQYGNNQIGQQIYHTLYNHRFLESYLMDIVDDITDRLINASNQWEGYQINGPYNRKSINIYLVKGHAFPQSSLIPYYRIDLSKDNIKMNAVVDEENQIIFIDIGLIKKLITCAMMKEKYGTKTQHAVAKISINGLDAYKYLWDTAQNSSLNIRDYGQTWELMFRGMFAFIIGHELGHIYVGTPMNDIGRKTIVGYEERDRDLRWACQDLVDPKYQQIITNEKKADDICAKLISKVYFPEGVTPTPRLWYELGAGYLFDYFMAEELINALQISQSPKSYEIAEYAFGRDLARALLKKISDSDAGVMKTIFTKDHPASILRIIEFKEKLSMNEYSAFHGKSFMSDRIAAEQIQQLRMEICAQLKQKYNIK